MTAERDRLRIELDELAAEPEIAVHPGIAEIYRRQLADLAGALRADDPTAADARDIIRGLLDVVIATRRPDGRGVDLTLQGRLAAVLALMQTNPVVMTGPNVC